MTARELLFPLNQPKHEERVIVYKLGDICPICEAGNLTNKEIVATFDYKGESVEIPNEYPLVLVRFLTFSFIVPKG